MKKFNLEITVFLSGAVVMVLEIAGSRVMGPYVGGSTFVWTSLIGIILGALSIGYYLGGKIADKSHNPNVLSLLIVISAFFIGLTTLIKDPVLSAIQSSDLGIRMASVIGATILFTPASIFLGTISPYAIRLKMNDVKTSGSTVGNLYAISTIGSIFGTFLAGFYLIAKLGNTKLLLVLSLTLLIASFFPTLNKTKKSHVATIIILLISIFFINQQTVKAEEYLVEMDSQYNDIRIIDGVDQSTKRPIRTLKMNSVTHSAMFLDGKELVYEYTKYYRLGEHFNPALKKALNIGGGAYSYPKNFLQSFPNATLDVVEIDPKLTELAKQYFSLEDSPNLNIYHEDGRTFLNKSQKKYDAIFLDAFGSYYSVPYQLTTLETVEKLYEMMEDDGIIIVNIISALEGEKAKFFQAEYKTYQEIFPQVYVFQVRNYVNPDQPQNLMLVALKSETPAPLTSNNTEFNTYLNNRWTKEIESDIPILTDDFAPVDQYIMEFLD